ncbi:hypothetical protein QJN73_25710, partial [Escherichia coli]
IGDDSISIFTYDIKSNFFEIRDNIGTENIFSSFSDFSSFLNELNIFSVPILSLISKKLLLMS